MFISVSFRYAVRKAVNSVLGAIASLVLPLGPWQSLNTALEAAANSGNLALQSRAIAVLGSVCNPVLKYRPELKTVVANGILCGLRAADADIVQTTSETVLTFIESLEQKELKEILPHLLPLLFDILKKDQDEKTSGNIFEIFSELLLVLAKPHVRQLYPSLAEVAVFVTAKKDCEVAVRIAAEDFLEELIAARPKLVKGDILSLFLNCAYSICCETEAEDEDETIDVSGRSFSPEDESGAPGSDEITPLQLGTSLWNALCEVVPSKRLFAASAPFVLQGLTSADGKVFRGSLTSLGILSKSCADHLKQYLGKVMPLLLQAMGSSEGKTVELATFCLFMFSQNLQPTIAEHRDVIFAAVFTFLAKSPRRVARRRCWGVLLEFVSSLEEEELAPYLPTLMDLITANLLGRVADGKDVALDTLSYVALTAKQSFLPYFDSTMKLLEPLLHITDEKELKLRILSLDVFGSIATAVGGAKFLPYYGPVLTSAFQMATEFKASPLYEDMREVFCQTVFDFLQSCSSDVAAQMIPLIIKTVFEIALSGKTEFKTEDFSTYTEDDDEEEEDEDADGVAYNSLDTVSASATAITALGIMSECHPSAFLPYLREAWTVLAGLRGEGTDESIREACFYALPLLVANKAVQDGAATAEMVKEYVGFVGQAVADEYERRVVLKALDGFSVIIKRFGASAVDSHLNAIGGCVVTVLCHKAQCQSVEGEEEVAEGEEDEDGESESDFDLVEACGEVVVELCRSYQESASRVLALFAPHFLRMISPKNDTFYRSVGCGTLAESISVSHCDTLPIIDGLMKVMLASTKDREDSTLRRNAAFCIGVALQHLSAGGERYVNAALQALSSLILNEAEEGVVRDNALSAALRITAKYHAALPLPSILKPVLTALPLRSDFEEESPVYTALIAITQHTDEQVCF